MKLLVFSDIHEDFRAASNLVRKSGDVDVVVGAGDYGLPRQDLGDIIGALMPIKRPTVLVSGNCETTKTLKSTCRPWQNARVLHGDQITIDGLTFFGIGGGIPITPFGSWSYDFTENEASQLLAGCPAGGILVSHSPPKGILDVSSDGRSLGSTAIKETISMKMPSLVVCGHIHASAGQVVYNGPTTIINAGPEGIIWDLNDRV